MIRLAFIKYAGMAAGGVEKYLQTLAAHLPKDIFNIDFYYTDDTPLIGNSFVHPATSIERVEYCKKNESVDFYALILFLLKTNKHIYGVS